MYSRLDVEAVSDVVRRGRLRWFGHLERKSPDDWVSACRDLQVDGVKRKGRSRKPWGECVRNDMVSLGLKRDWALDRVGWRGAYVVHFSVLAWRNGRKTMTMMMMIQK